MNPVRQGFIDVLAILRRDEWRDHKVHVTKEEENDDGEGSADRWVPIPRLAVQIKVYQPCRNEGVYNGKRIRNEAVK